jgi:hypothetical protein
MTKPQEYYLFDDNTFKPCSRGRPPSNARRVTGKELIDLGLAKPASYRAADKEYDHSPKQDEA